MHRIPLSYGFVALMALGAVGCARDDGPKGVPGTPSNVPGAPSRAAAPERPSAASDRLIEAAPDRVEDAPGAAPAGATKPAIDAPVAKSPTALTGGPAEGVAPQALVEAGVGTALPSGKDPLVGYTGRSHTVDGAGKGDFLTIAAAIAAASAGDRIEVRPGTYRETVRVERPLAIVGLGEPGSVIVEQGGDNVVVVDAVRALIRGLTLRQTGGEPSRYGVDIKRGRVVIDNCEITSASLAAIAAHGRAQAVITRNRVHDSAQSGLFFYESATAEVIGNDIVGNGKAGIESKSTGRITLRRNRVHDGGSSGLFLHSGADAIIEDNEVSRNRLAGIEIKAGARAELRRNQILAGNQSGLFINAGARALVEENTFRGNGLAAIEVKGSTEVTIRRNTLAAGKQSGIFINAGSKALVEDNIIDGSGLAGIEVKASSPDVRGNTVRNGKMSGIYVHSQSGGTFVDNRVSNNTKAGFEVSTGATPVVQNNRVEGNGYQGIWITAEGRGRYAGNTLARNVKGPWRLDGEAARLAEGDIPSSARQAPPVEAAAKDRPGKAPTKSPMGATDRPSDLKRLIDSRSDE